MTDPEAPGPEAPRGLSLRQLLPNLLTVAALCAGLTAIRLAALGDPRGAVLLILLAGALDFLDGRLARALQGESEIGAQLDSLADSLNFGVAPGLAVYFAHGPEGGLLWVAVVILAVCCVLRLARFNVGARAATNPGTTFQGVPAPAGAGLALLPLYLSFAFPGLHLPSGLVAAWLVLIGLLMISRVPTPSAKGLRVSPANARFVVVGFVALLALLLTFPWGTATLCCALYLGSVGWSARRGGGARPWS